MIREKHLKYIQDCVWVSLKNDTTVQISLGEHETRRHSFINLRQDVMLNFLDWLKEHKEEISSD